MSPSLRPWTAFVDRNVAIAPLRLAAAVAARGGEAVFLEFPPPSQPPTLGPKVWIAAGDAPIGLRPVLRISDDPLPPGAPWDVRRAPLASSPELLAETAELLAAAADLARQGEEWRRAAHADPLTGLLNRRGWEAASTMTPGGSTMTPGGSTMTPGGEGIGVVVFDLDDFHSVNDRFSHAAGDACLVQFGKLLLEAAARRGTLPRREAARLGGDEFVLCCPCATREETAAIADDVVSRWNAQAAAARREAAEKGEPAAATTTVSAGWSWCFGLDAGPGPNAALAAAVESADHALLAAKREGKARVAAAP